MGLHIRLLRNNRPDDEILKCKGKIILNDIDSDVDGIEKVKNHLYTELTGNLSIKPSCACGHLRENLTYKQVGDEVCPKCSGTVTKSFEQDITSNVYIRSPDHLGRVPLPAVVHVIANDVMIDKFNPVAYLLDRRYKVPNNLRFRIAIRAENCIKELKEAGIERGLAYFVNNLDHIVSTFITMPSFKAKKLRETLGVFYRRNKNYAMTKHLYLLPQSLYIIDKVNTSSFSDLTLTPMLDVALSMVDLVSRDEIAQEDIMGRALVKLGEFYKTHTKASYNGKKGIARSAIFSTRGANTSRAVITSITGPHRYDEIEAPWAIGVLTFRTQIISKLLKNGYNIRECYSKIQEVVFTYDEEIDKIMETLIAECGYRGIPCLLQRYPVLGSGSLPLVYMSKIKKLPRDVTIGLSILIVGSLNADFDGDAVHVTPLLDRDTAEGFMPLEYHNNIFDRLRARKITGWLGMPRPVVTQLAHFMENGKQLRDDQVGIDKMLSLYGE